MAGGARWSRGARPRRPRRRRAPRAAGAGAAGRVGARAGRCGTRTGAGRLGWPCADRRRIRARAGPSSTGGGRVSRRRRWTSRRPSRSSPSRPTPSSSPPVSFAGDARSAVRRVAGAGRGALGGAGGAVAAAGAVGGGAAVVAVEARALEDHADGVEQLAQPALALWALGQRVVGEALELLEGVTALGAGVLVGGHSRGSSEDSVWRRSCGGLAGTLALRHVDCQWYGTMTTP